MRNDRNFETQMTAGNVPAELERQIGKPYEQIDRGLDWLGYWPVVEERDETLYVTGLLEADGDVWAAGRWSQGDDMVLVDIVVGTGRAVVVPDLDDVGSANDAAMYRTDAVAFADDGDQMTPATLRRAVAQLTTIRAAALEHNVSRPTLYLALRRGQLTGHRIAAMVVLDRTEVARFVEQLPAYGDRRRRDPEKKPSP